MTVSVKERHAYRLGEYIESTGADDTRVMEDEKLDMSHQPRAPIWTASTKG